MYELLLIIVPPIVLIYVAIKMWHKTCKETADRKRQQMIASLGPAIWRNPHLKYSTYSVYIFEVQRRELVKALFLFRDWRKLYDPNLRVLLPEVFEDTK